MDQQPIQDGEADEDVSPTLNLDGLRSYLTFARNAIASRKALVAAVLVAGLVLTFAIAKYLPPTYTCTTVMMAVSSGPLEPDRGGTQPLAGAEGSILSHNSLQRLIDKIQLKQKYAERRPPLLKLKDRIKAAISGPMDDETLTTVLIGTLGNKIAVRVENRDTLTIDVSWSDAETAAEIADAARSGFLSDRHTAETSAFQDKMAILDSHAAALRTEIGTLAEQMKQVLAEKRSQLEAEAKAQGGAPAPAPATKTVKVRRPSPSAGQLPELRAQLGALKQKLTAAENERDARMRAEQAKLDELLLRFTPSHPQVLTQQERLGMASQVPSQLALMRSEVPDLESQIRQGEAMEPGTATVAGGEALPTEVLQLLDEQDADPALAAQISGAVRRYGSLRDEIRGAQLNLDTVQAAFSRRYQVTTPAEAPSTPTKPKKAVIGGAGAFLSLLLALLLPVLLEFRRDILSESWQVTQMRLPVLAELRLPPNRGD
jgi:uncharacterized protein involved in exopolysaccharide biosynthesis